MEDTTESPEDEPLKLAEPESQFNWMFVIVPAVVVLAVISVLVTRKPKSARRQSISISELPFHVVPGSGTKYVAKYDYFPTMLDEITIKKGDIVVFETLWLDGWGEAVNRSTGQKGIACSKYF